MFICWPWLFRRLVRPFFAVAAAPMSLLWKPQLRLAIFAARNGGRDGYANYKWAFFFIGLWIAAVGIGLITCGVKLVFIFFLWAVSRGLRKWSSNFNRTYREKHAESVRKNCWNRMVLNQLNPLRRLHNNYYSLILNSSLKKRWEKKSSTRRSTKKRCR